MTTFPFIPPSPFPLDPDYYGTDADHIPILPDPLSPDASQEQTPTPPTSPGDEVSNLETK